MKNIEQIKDEVAQERDFKSWQDFERHASDSGLLNELKKMEDEAERRYIQQKESMQKLFFDMDGVLASYKSALDKGLDPKDEGFYLNLELMPHAKETVNELKDYYDLYILSTPAWSKPHSWSEKRIWLEKHFGDIFFKKVFLTHRKDLVKGDYLVDDHTWNGADKFEGEFIHLGTEKFPTLKEVKEYLLQKAKQDERDGKKRIEQFYSEPKGKGLDAILPDSSSVNITDEYEPFKNGNSKSNNTMDTLEEKSYEQVLGELKESIATELGLCNPLTTPAICQMKADADGYQKVEDMIVKLVGDNGISISQAILEVEKAYNPNIPQD